MRDVTPYLEIIEKIDPIKVKGKVTKMVGSVIESLGPNASTGELCYLYPPENQRKICAEVIGFRDDKILLMPVEETQGIKTGMGSSEIKSTANFS